MSSKFCTHPVFTEMSSIFKVDLPFDTWSSNRQQGSDWDFDPINQKNDVWYFFNSPSNQNYHICKISHRQPFEVGLTKFKRSLCKIIFIHLKICLLFSGEEYLPLLFSIAEGKCPPFNPWTSKRQQRSERLFWTTDPKTQDKKCLIFL